MNTTRPTGLGEPELNGKLSLFRPPDQTKNKQQPRTESEGNDRGSNDLSTKRVRTTLDLTWGALQVVQELQQRHRLKTGKVLPLWKAASMAIEGFAQAGKKNKGRHIQA
jgi:hypothetical protein